jgi:peroxiredoxin
VAGVVLSAWLVFCALGLFGQGAKIVWSEQESPIVAQLGKLRSLGDAERASTTKQLAMQIRELPAGGNKGTLAEHLAGLATEGDPGRDALQEVATTLAQVLRERPVRLANRDEPAPPYVTLAELVRFEHVQASVNDPWFAAAMSKIDADEKHRQTIEFTLTDLQGKKWALKDLRGNVVLVNFWATWCPPCRKEMPDLEALHQRFKGNGLVVLAISDEDEGKVKPFIEEHKYSYPILLDAGRKVNGLFRVEGIPKSFVYDRNGKLVAQAMDMRTRKQFLEMLALAGIE